MEPSMLESAIVQHGAGVRIAVKVIPRSPRNQVSGCRDGRLLLRVTAPPVDSAANEAVVALLAEALDVPRRQITIAAGQTSRQKLIDVQSIAAGVARARLAAQG